MAETMLDLAQANVSELLTISRNPAMQTNDVVIETETLEEAQQRFGVEWWAGLDGAIVRWGDPQLADLISYWFRRLRESRSGSSEREVSAILRSRLFRVIMPDGSICDTRMMEFPGNASRPGPTDRHILLGWSSFVPELSIDDAKYFFVERMFVLQVEQMARPSEPV